MTSYDHTVTDPAGLHARPAGVLIKTLQGFESDITLTAKGKTVSAKKLFAVMGLAVKCGDTITLSADGPDAAEAITAAQTTLAAEGI